MKANAKLDRRISKKTEKISILMFKTIHKKRKNKTSKRPHLYEESERKKTGFEE